jgi:hypothetical protein
MTMQETRQNRVSPDSSRNPEGPRRNRAKIAAEATLNVLSHIGHGVVYNRAFPFVVTLGVGGLAFLLSQGNVVEALTVTVAGAVVGRGIQIEQNLSRTN